MFERFGDCKKVLIPPQGGVSALIIMGNAVDAKKAFKALAYSRFRTQPLYLEWAPHDAISGSETSAEKVEGVEENTKTKKSKRELTYEEKVRERKRRQGILEEEEKEEVEEAVEEAENDQKDEEKATETVKNGEEDIFEPESTLFVKNLSFDTNDAALDAFFRRKYNIRSAQVSKKLNPSNPSKNLSMGFGFVQFYTRNEAMKALKEMQGELLEGHSIELKISHRQTLDKDSMKRKTVEKTKQGDCTKILVRNIPFTAKIKEVESLFSTFGDIQNVRIPKKLGSKDQHRGFGFVDFASKEEAKRAFDSLVHSTHLYGRHLVLEWAKEDDSVEELREKTAEKFSGEKGAKKKRKAQLEAIQKQLQVVDDEKQ
ncbi:unnamed protein product [Caenorhabditis auriculariae]|uniref:RRM domain-containing protein n=1 Tax=Caenorhabditis auriculariae TaxID=2777116 RepID=A0A8S1HFP4_9PELO|nr:unnamed protein product [Caenorhabditis auriculariae]